jgi:hypothetical protein
MFPIDFHDASPQPKDGVKIESITTTPYADRFRIHLHIKVTPFLERPNLIIMLHDDEDSLIGELNIIETMHFDMEFTMHIRGKHDPAGVYTITAQLFYESKNPPQDQYVVGFVVPEAPTESPA